EGLPLCVSSRAPWCFLREATSIHARCPYGHSSLSHARAQGGNVSSEPEPCGSGLTSDVNTLHEGPQTPHEARYKHSRVATPLGKRGRQKWCMQMRKTTNP